MDIGNKIKDLCTEKKIPIRDLADKVGLTRQAINRILKTNSTSIETLGKISEALGVPVAYFFGEPIRDPLTQKELETKDKRIRELEERIKDKEKIIKSYEKDIESITLFSFNVSASILEIDKVADVSKIGVMNEIKKEIRRYWGKDTLEFLTDVTE